MPRSIYEFSLMFGSWQVGTVRPVRSFIYTIPTKQGHRLRIWQLYGIVNDRHMLLP
jgi:hypothetical protein